MQAPPQARAILGQFLLNAEEVGYRIGVPSVWPAGSNVTISGQATTGQVLTGATPPPLQFGTVTIRTSYPQTTTVGAVASAQAFGTPTIKTVIRTGPGGIPSAQAFGTVSLYALYRLTPTGLGSAQAFGSIVTRTGFTRAVGGVSSAQAFGTPLATVKQIVAAGGVPSAQAFGTTAERPGPVTIPVAGIPSAQAFGTALVAFNVWLRELDCLPVTLQPTPDSDSALAALVCISPNPTICGVPICGDGHLCGGLNVFLHNFDCLSDSPSTAILNRFVLGTTRLAQQSVVYMPAAPAPLVLALQPVGS